ncbi:Integrase catalytic domain-containing protein [Mycena venus]|uniref:Integrase catalytic domain-containing protein n=1 Tax=Mycena venus TaxID=2733690 RepID=A0A8H6Z6Z3_9AGAR|nr:Integrase catalytic domain-containing protein [Mycena venus]
MDANPGTSPSTGIPPSFSSNNPFRITSIAPARVPSASFDETPQRPTLPQNVNPAPRRYVPGRHRPRLTEVASRHPAHGYESDSSPDEDALPPQPHSRREYRARADHYESVSDYAADHGPFIKPLTMTNNFPEDAKLALEKGNYKGWATKVWFTIGLNAGATRWLDPHAEPPSLELYPRANRTWHDNDVAIRSFITLACASSEHKYFEDCTTAAAVWSTLRERHTKRGPLDQVNKLREAMNMQFGDDPKSWAATLETITNLNTAVWAGDAPTSDGILTVLLHALSPFPYFVDSLLAVPNLDAAYITARLTDKQSMPNLHGPPVNPHALAAAASASKKGKQICSNPVCTDPGSHTYPYCVQKGATMGRPGGGRKKDEKTDGGNMKVNRDKEGYACVMINGESFRLAPTPPNPAPAPPVANFINLRTDDLPAFDPIYDFEAFLAEEEPQVSLDWGEFTVNMTATTPPAEYVLFSDTGANVHVSPYREDFATFNPIAPRAVKGFQGSSINATGIGTVINNKFTLDNVLYVPNASIRLMSVSRLCQANSYTCHFDSTTTWITDVDGNIVCTGSIHEKRELYRLHCVLLTLPRPSTNPIAAAASIDLYHRRLGHAHHQAVADLYQHQLVDGMDLDPSSSATPCDACIRGKQVKAAIPKLREGPKSKRRLAVVYVDLCGAFDKRSRSGNYYTLDIVDDATTRGFSLPVADKFQAFDTLIAWQIAVETRTGERVGAYNIDNGELKSAKFSAFCAARGTEIRYTAPETSAQNGKVERFHLTILNKARAMMIACNAPLYLWDEFVVTAAYLHARTPSKSQMGHTPFEGFELRKPNIAHLREIGCRAFVLVRGHNPKLNPRSIECVLIGYAPQSKAYRCWERSSGKIYNTIDVRFIESCDTVRVKLNKELLAALPNPQPPCEPAVPNDQSSDDPPLTASDPPSPDTLPVAPPPPATFPPSPLEPSAPPLRRSSRPRATPKRADALTADADAPEDQGEQQILDDWAATEAATPEDDDGEEAAMLAQLNAYLCENPIDVEYPDDPRNHAEAMAAPDADKCVEATHEELNALRDKGVHELVPRSDVPPQKTLLDLRAVYHRKRDMSGAVARNRVRYCVKGFRQVYGRDYTSTTSPTARLESFRAVLHVAASRGWDIQQVDIKTAFLNATLPENEIQYSRQPKHFEVAGKEDWVWKLLKSLYGLKQSGRVWNKELHESMVGWGFKRLLCEWCIYVRIEAGRTNLVAIHVDDMICAATDRLANEAFKNQLRSKWEISDLGDVNFCLGIGIVRDPERRTIALSQTALIDRLVAQFHQIDAHPAPTPMEAGLRLRRPSADDPKPTQLEVDRLAETPYRSLVGGLMYVAIGTRPDIAFAVHHLAGFLDCYGFDHWRAAIRVLRYLKGTRTLALVLGGPEDILLAGFGDADFANDVEKRKSVMGYSFSLGAGSISWASRKQKVVTLSSTEAEYIAVSEAAKEACWLRMLLRGITVPIDVPTPLSCDNNAARILANDQALHSRAKHIDNRYHHIRDCVEKKKIFTPHIPSHDNIADTLTKALPAPDFLRHRANLGIR